MSSRRTSMPALMQTGGTPMSIYHSIKMRTDKRSEFDDSLMRNNQREGNRLHLELEQWEKAQKIVAKGMDKDTQFFRQKAQATNPSTPGRPYKRNSLTHDHGAGLGGGVDGVGARLIPDYQYKSRLHGDNVESSSPSAGHPHTVGVVSRAQGGGEGQDVASHHNGVESKGKPRETDPYHHKDPDSRRERHESSRPSKTTARSTREDDEEGKKDKEARRKARGENERNEEGSRRERKGEDKSRSEGKGRHDGQGHNASSKNSRRESRGQTSKGKESSGRSKGDHRKTLEKSKTSSDGQQSASDENAKTTVDDDPTANSSVQQKERGGSSKSSSLLQADNATAASDSRDSSRLHTPRQDRNPHSASSTSSKASPATPPPSSSPAVPAAAHPKETPHGRPAGGQDKKDGTTEHAKSMMATSVTSDNESSMSATWDGRRRYNNLWDSLSTPRQKSSVRSVRERLQQEFASPQQQQQQQHHQQGKKGSSKPASRAY